jgi:hypothetical protein
MRRRLPNVLGDIWSLSLVVRRGGWESTGRGRDGSRDGSRDDILDV